MQRVSVQEAAIKLGISKEAVYNRIRRNTIDFIEENGVKFVLLEDNKTNKQSQTITNKHSNFKEKNGDFVEYLIKEINELKSKVNELQSQKESLFREKEELLISSKNEIKEMYRERDEKLQYFLSLFERPLLSKQVVVDLPDENLDVNFEENSQDKAEEMENSYQNLTQNQNSEWMSLANFMNFLDLKKKKRSKIKKILVKNIGKSEFIRVENDMLMIHREIDLEILKEEEDEES